MEVVEPGLHVPAPEDVSLVASQGGGVGRSGEGGSAGRHGPLPSGGQWTGAHLIGPYSEIVLAILLYSSFFIFYFLFLLIIGNLSVAAINSTFVVCAVPTC